MCPVAADQRRVKRGGAQAGCSGRGKREEGGGREDHLYGGGVNIQAINVNDGECDASGRSIYRRPTDRLTAGQGQDSWRIVGEMFLF